MFNFDYITKEYIKKNNSKWLEIPDYPYQMLINGGSGSGKTNALLKEVRYNKNLLIKFL